MNPAASTASDTPAPFHPASSPDYIPAEQLRSLQSQRLRQVVARAYEHVSLFRQRMHKRGLTPAEIRGVEDMARLPFTLKSDLGDTYPFGMFAVPLQQVVRLRPRSGAGSSTVAAYTRADLEVWRELLVRCLASCGIHRGDVVQNVCGHTRFTDALALNDAAESLGATVIPVVAGGDADHQVAVAKDFDVSAVCATPGYFLHLVERAEKLGVDLRELPLRAGVFVGGPWSEALRRRIEESAGIRAYEIYGLPELLGPGVGAECAHQDGLHVFEDHFYPEVVDPQSGDPLPDGREGALVLTALSKEAVPMVRYRTPDLAAIVAEPCPCGRTMRRIRRIGRRSDDVLVIAGTGVFPSQIEAALLAVEGSLPPYQIVLAQEEGVDRVEVQIEVTPQVLSDEVGAMESLQSKLGDEIEQALGLRVPVRLVEPHSISRGPGRGRRIVDRRGT